MVRYCKTLIFGSHLILALLVIKDKTAKIKKTVSKDQRALEKN